MGRKQKINEEQCKDIARRFNSGESQRELAKEYNVCQPTIKNAIYRQRNTKQQRATKGVSLPENSKLGFFETVLNMAQRLDRIEEELIRINTSQLTLESLCLMFERIAKATRDMNGDRAYLSAFPRFTED